jgi:hypothetical protein
VLSIDVHATQYVDERELVFWPGVHGDVRFSQEHVARNAMWAKAVHTFVHDVELANFHRKPESSTYFLPVIKQL